jgi:hypothetical protein
MERCKGGKVRGRVGVDTNVMVEVGASKVRDESTAIDGVEGGGEDGGGEDGGGEDDADCSAIAAIDKNKSMLSQLLPLAAAFEWAKGIRIFLILQSSINAHAIAQAASASNCASGFEVREGRRRGTNGR